MLGGDGDIGAKFVSQITCEGGSCGLETQSTGTPIRDAKVDDFPHPSVPTKRKFAPERPIEESSARIFFRTCNAILLSAASTNIETEIR